MTVNYEIVEDHLVPPELLRPIIVCLCGSTRFGEAFRRANLEETLAGRIVLSIGCTTQSDAHLQASGIITDEVKTRLDELHKRKIDLADEILVLNVGRYVGDSTRSEIAYAEQTGKRVRFLEEGPRVDDGLTNAQRRLVELDLRKPEITAYYEELERVLVAVAIETDIDGYFEAPDGTVYKLVVPSGQFVTYKHYSYERTKREGETRGTLSMKEVADARANGFRPLPAEGAR